MIRVYHHPGLASACRSNMSDSLPGSTPGVPRSYWHILVSHRKLKHAVFEFQLSIATYDE
eukprot:scaffold2666_cov78-Skeletonema_dohrnii-CCMP3373.AAC.3